MILGTVFMLGALSLFIYNEREAAAAGEASMIVVPQIKEEIRKNQQIAQESGTEPPREESLEIPVEYLDPSAFEMKEVEIDGYGYIGYLSIPKLELDLPIMSQWDNKRLRIAPCRYVGSVRGEDLVLMAHNYAKHFGRLSQLSQGDMVIFTDMDGVVTQYQVMAQDILAPDAVEEMTAGAFDLTLFTCTYGGRSRVTVYCDKRAD